MKKKKFIKLLLSTGDIQRNEAVEIARSYIEDGCTYAEAFRWEVTLMWLDYRGVTTPGWPLESIDYCITGGNSLPYYRTDLDGGGHE